MLTDGDGDGDGDSGAHDYQRQGAARLNDDRSSPEGDPLPSSPHDVR